MAALEHDDSAPAFRFKRRKLQHPKKARIDDDSVLGESATPASPAGSRNSPVPQTQTPIDEQEENVPNLKEILRQRRRPQQRMKEVARKTTEAKTDALVQLDAPKADIYHGRFVAQTGQVRDHDDEQLAKYVEARMAEKNHRQYGWPIPKHLESLVATMTPSTEQLVASSSSPFEPSLADRGDKGIKPDQDNRMAAGMGKLQEIDLGPEAAARNIQRTEEAERRLRGIPVETTEKESQDKAPPTKGGKRRRWQKRRNSEDVRRDEMVEAVLREAKLEYFEEDKPPSPSANDAGNADEAMVEQFRRDFLESIESRIQRKPAPPPGPKGVPEPPKGPKLGGSRSARAAMHAQQQQAAKNKR